MMISQILILFASTALASGLIVRLMDVILFDKYWGLQCSKLRMTC